MDVTFRKTRQLLWNKNDNWKSLYFYRTSAHKIQENVIYGKNKKDVEGLEKKLVFHKNRCTLTKHNLKDIQSIEPNWIHISAGSSTTRIIVWKCPLFKKFINPKQPEMFSTTHSIQNRLGSEFGSVLLKNWLQTPYMISQGCKWPVGNLATARLATLAPMAALHFI